MPGDDSAAWRSMGNYVFDTQTLIDIVTPRDDAVHRPRRATSSRRSRATGVAHVYDFSNERRARPGRPRARLLARRRHDRLVLRREHGPDRPAAGVQPLQRPVAGVHVPRQPRRRRRCHAGRAASRRSSTAACCARARSCRARTSSARSSPPACYVDHDAHVTDSILFPGVHVGAGRPAPPVHHRQERHRARLVPHRPRRDATTASGSPSATAASP